MEIAQLRKKISSSSRATPRVHLFDEEMCSASEEAESSDDLSQGLGRWFKVVKTKRGRFETTGKTVQSATSMEKDLMTLANNMPRTEFLRIARKLTKDAGVSMELCAPEKVDATPLQSNENEHAGQGLSADPVVTPSGSRLFLCLLGGRVTGKAM